MVTPIRRILIGSIATLVTVAWIVVWQPPAGASSFFEGKSIRLVVGYSPGGGFDTFARLVARHLPRHIPGHPSIIVQTMPGAGSVMAANWVYEKRPGDGLMMVNFHFNIVTQSFVDPAVKFDPLQYIWLGEPSMGGLPQTVWVRGDLPIKSLDDLKKSKEPITFGSTGAGTGPSLVSEFLKMLGLPVRTIHGYKGSSDVMAAMERKEVHGRITSQDTMMTVYKRYVEGNQVRPILSMGSDPRIEPLPGLATLEDLQMTPAQRRLADFLIDSFALLRVYALPPGTPADRVEILRRAFTNALKDPKLVNEAERQGVTVSPLGGERVQEIIRKMAKTPPEVLAQYKKLIGKK